MRMLSDMSLLIAFLLFPLLTSAFYTNCQNGTTYQCLNSENSSVTLSSTSVQLANCVFINCPSLLVPDNSILTLRNVSFIAPKGDQGVFKFGANVLANFDTLSITNGVHATLCSLHLNSANTNLTITNGRFFNNTGNKGVLCATATNTFATCTNCFFDSLVSVRPGYGGSGTASGGGVVIVDSSIVQNHNQRAFRGSGAGSSVILSNSVFRDLVSTTTSNLIVSGDTSCSIVLSNVTGYRISGNGNGAAIGTYLSVLVYINNCNFSDIYSNSQGGAFLIQFSSMAWVNNTIVQRSVSSAEGGVFYAYNYGRIFITNCIFRDCASGAAGGVLDITAYSSANLTNCTLERNSAPSAGIVSAPSVSTLGIRDCIFRSNNEAAIFVGDWNSVGSSVWIDGTTLIQGNVGGNAGGIEMSSYSTVILSGPSIQIVNNRGGLGGGIVVNSNSVLRLAVPSLFLTGNSCSSLGQAAGIRFKGSSPINPLQFTNSISASGSMDRIYVDNNNVAQYIINGTAYYAQQCPDCQFSGKASSIALLPSTGPINITDKSLLFYTSTVTLDVSQPLPDMRLAAIDYFSNVNGANVNSPVVIRLSLNGNNSVSNFNGESMKAIVDSNLNSVLFSGVSLFNVGPGTYNISVEAIGSTLKALPIPLPMPLLTVVYKSCDPLLERFIATEAKCYPAKNVSSPIRVTFSLIALIFFLISSVACFFLVKLRTFPVMRVNSSLFLLIIAIGCNLMFASVFVRVTPYSESCMLSSWLENIGFALIFGSLWLKSYRILKVFSGKKSSAGVSDADLLSALAILIALVIGYLIAWQVVSPSVYQDTYVNGSKVYVDTCSQSTFSIASIVTRIFAQLLVSIMAFEIRNVPHEFNESQQIALTANNWLVFGALISFIVQGSNAIADWQIAFSIWSFSTIATSFLTLSCLIFPKIVTCFKEGSMTVGGVFSRAVNTSHAMSNRPVVTLDPQKSFPIDNIRHGI